MKTRRGGVRVAVAGWGMAAVLLVTACSGDDGDGADAESAGGGDVAEVAGEAEGVTDQIEPTDTDCATEVELPQGYPADRVPLVTCDATVRDDVVNDTFVYVV